MLFTRTLRRTMMFGLVMVLVMLTVLFLSGLSGLRSYRALVDDLNFRVNEAPRHVELMSAVDALFEPLVAGLHESNRARHRLRQIEFRRRLDVAKQAVREFHLKFEGLPPTDAVSALRPVTETLLLNLSDDLAALERLHHQALKEPDPNDEQVAERIAEIGAAGGNLFLEPCKTMVAMMSSGVRADRKRDPQPGTLEKMLSIIGAVQRKALRVPDYQDGLNATLEEAGEAYRYHFRLICWTMGIVALLFVGLMSYGYLGIFSPLTKLHQGACRVAQGDFDYRVELSSQTEVAELADAFNKMTARFQEIKQDLDRQVRERSRQLVRSERLAGIGFLAAGVAHEINNPLSAIAMASESLDSRAAETSRDDVTTQYLGMIQREAFRCQQITAKLLDFARGQDATRGRFDLTSLINEVLSMAQHMSKYRGRHIVFSRAEPCYAEVNGPEIKQVVLNLVANALESMDDGSTLEIELVEQTDQVIMTFRDEGCGMSPEVIENIFDPFFTRRKDGKGTGLGMSISHRIITDHGGTIEAASDGAGHGSTFRVHLPRHAAKPQAA